MVEEKTESTSEKKNPSMKKGIMDSKEKKDEKEDKKGKDEMTEEDIKLKEDLEMLMQRLNEADISLYQPTLETMRSIIRASTTSMTSVPKPLKFMRPHYATIKEIHKKMAEGPTKRLCADIISVLAMTSDSKNDCINYRMMGRHEPIGDWGHEYVRHLAMEMAEEWRSCGDGTNVHNKRREQLLTLTREIVLHNMKHNAEVEACDLLIEIERLDLLSEYVEEVDHGRVCLYLLSCSPLMPDPDNEILIKTAMNIYRKFGKNFDALRCAIILNAVPIMREIVLSTKDILEQKQMAILLGRHQIFLDLEGVENGEKLMELNSNANLHTYFHSLARELDIMEPKTPEGIYKSHLEQSRPFAGSSASDSVRSNLAAAFVNGFVNTGFGVDKMMTEAEDASRWFYKNKEYGMLSAAASQGLVWRWDIDTGLAQCDRFLYVNDDFIKAGTLLAIGIISSGIQDTCDPAAALLMDHINSDRAVMRIGSVFGLGLAYANSKRLAVLKKEDGGVVYELKKLLLDTKPSATAEVKGLAALSIGFILVGTCDHITACELFNYLNEKTAVEMQDSNYRFVALGIALIFLGAQQKSEVFVEMVRALPDPFGTMFSTLIDVCAYAGTGNVLKIQKLLHICSEHYETKETKEAKRKTNKDDKSDIRKEGDASSEKPDYSTQQAVAVLGIGLIAMGEEIGAQMSLRMFGHLIRYGEPVIRRAVPLALALISTSNPQLSILESLSKFSHDADAETAHNAIFAMGLVGAGTNNARLVSMLRQLASYHHKDQVSLMLVRLAQGMTHMGKGTMTLNPFHSDRQLMCPAAVAGLLTICYAFLEANNSVLNNRQHYLLYSLTLAMQPRLLITLVEDEVNPENLKQVNVSVRVGQAVDVVAQAGKPKTITGFQTHTTPVLMAYGERAELANEEYISLTPYLEGLVILRKNPIYETSTAEMKKK
ncbi:Proteasome/cyclosome repeat family protein [Brugia pahangi]